MKVDRKTIERARRIDEAVESDLQSETKLDPVEVRGWTSAPDGTPCPTPGCDNAAHSVMHVPGAEPVVVMCRDCFLAQRTGVHVIEPAPQRTRRKPFDRATFDEHFGRIMSRWPTRQLTGDLLDGYFDEVKYFHRQDFIQAMANLYRTAIHPPIPQDMINACRDAELERHRKAAGI